MLRFSTTLIGWLILTIFSSGNVSAGNSITAPGSRLQMTDVVVANLTELRNQTPGARFHLLGEVFVTYEETRSGGNWKFVQDANSGILIEDRLGVLQATYGEGTGLINLYGTLEPGVQLKLIPDGTDLPWSNSTGNVVSPISLTYEDYYADCYRGIKYESMLVMVTTPMVVFDDYGGGGPPHPYTVWTYNSSNLYDMMDLATTTASGRYDWFIQSVFNSPLVTSSTAIPPDPAIYSGIRTNVNWGNSSTPLIYGLFTPRKAGDINQVNSPRITIPTILPISKIKPNQCGSATVKIYNEGAGILQVTELQLVNGSSEFQITSQPTTPFYLGAWTFQPIQIGFCPLNEGNETIDLLVKYGSGQTLLFPVSGTTIPYVNLPVISITPPQISDIKPNQCGSATIKIFNEGIGNLHITGLGLVNGPADEFHLVSPPNTPFDLGAGSYRTIQIDFCPSNLGNETISLSVAYGTGQTLLSPISGTTIPRPDAEFSSDIRVIDVGGSVNFHSLSTGDPTSWAWDFPGSVQGSSTAKNPTEIVYPEIGCFPVKLTATNDFNATGQRIKNPYILVAEPPMVPFYTEYFIISEMKTSSTLAGNGWKFVDNTGAGMGWQVRKEGVGGCFTHEDHMPSTTTGASGYLVLPADEYNCVIGSPSSKKVDAYAESPSFDCSGYDAVIFCYEQRFKICCNPPLMELQVSNNGGTSWTSFDVLKGRDQNAIWGNPVEKSQINITEVAQHQPNVKVRFYWKGSSEYFWMIDDIEVKGIKVCENFHVSISGNDKVYQGYSPMSQSTLSANVQGGVGPYRYLWSTGETTPNITVAPLGTTDYQLEVTDLQACKTVSMFTVYAHDARCGQKLDKVSMCKKEKNGKSTEICVSPNAVPAQLQTGATLGSCKMKQGLEGGISVIDFYEPDLLIYPNPSSGQVNLEISGWVDERLVIEVKDILGRVLFQKEIHNPGNQYVNSIELNPSGIYYISVKGNSLNLSKQVSVIR